MSVSQYVKTANGKTKMVIAADERELADAVAAVRDEPERVTPNIDNPDHGNVIVKDFIEDQDKAIADAGTAEHFPTSESSKELSRTLADMSKDERKEFMHEGVEDPAAPVDQQVAMRQFNEEEKAKAEKSDSKAAKADEADKSNKTDVKASDAKSQSAVDSKKPSK